jgi:adsorption protein B
VTVIDHAVFMMFLPLGVWILLSGLDDLFLDVVWIADWLRSRFRTGASPAVAAPSEGDPERRIAIFVPLWQEHAVIENMLEHNLAAIRYGNYAFFVGAYPNDDATIAAVSAAADRFPSVHLALCPHDGPTSKADCLNWIYQRMLLYEEQTGDRFEIVVLHDAEDLVHPDELRWMNRHCGDYGMVQIPVLPLPTPFRDLTHGVYCDEFAEYQTKDVPVRQVLGGFIPSNGVGTGYARWALEKLAGAEDNRIFEPASLTEDYENGYRLHRLGCPQLFIPIRFLSGQPVATREYFPARFSAALRQRTRWVTGLTLQSWERHGWRAQWRQLYWFWRDRKGLVGNPVTALANAILIYGAATWVWSLAAGRPWGLGRFTAGPAAHRVVFACLLLQLVRTGVRAACVSRIYGARFAFGVPVRMFWANWVNFLATVSAVRRYVASKLRGEPLVWVKTEHMYPTRAALAEHKRPFEEVLVGAGYVTAEQLAAARRSKPASARIGEHLLALGHLSYDQLYEALSLQQNVRFEKIDPLDVPLRVARALPGAIARTYKLLPVRIEAGRLYLAGPELPSDNTMRALRNYTRLNVQFQFTTPENFDELVTQLLARRTAAA